MKPNLWMYATTEEMRSTAGSLLVFGSEVFFRAKVIHELEKLKAIKGRIDEKEVTNPPLLPPDGIMEFSFEYLVDCIRILFFFESYMKAELISHGLIVHLINRQVQGFETLAKQQMERPVLVTEVMDIQSFDKKVLSFFQPKTNCTC